MQINTSSNIDQQAPKQTNIPSVSILAIVYTIMGICPVKSYSPNSTASILVYRCLRAFCTSKGLANTPSYLTRTPGIGAWKTSAAPQPYTSAAAKSTTSSWSSSDSWTQFLNFWRQLNLAHCSEILERRFGGTTLHVVDESILASQSALRRFYMKFGVPRRIATASCRRRRLFGRQNRCQWPRLRLMTGRKGWEKFLPLSWNSQLRSDVWNTFPSIELNWKNVWPRKIRWLSWTKQSCWAHFNGAKRSYQLPAVILHLANRGSCLMEWHVGPLKGKNVINVSRTTRFSHVNEAQAESSSHYSRVTKWLGSASRQHQMQIA